MVRSMRGPILGGLSIFLGLLVLAAVSLPAGSALAQQQPRKGGTFIVASGGEPSNIPEFVVSESSNHIVRANVLNRLLQTDQQLNIRPDLAESWAVAPDGLSYTFKLVRNAKWHDGKPFTSADAKFNLESLYPLVSFAGVWWKNVVEAVQAPDEYTVVVRLKQPFAPFLAIMASNEGAYMYPKHLYEGTDVKNNPANRLPIGTGPFKFKDWVTGQYIELVRNDSYFKAGLPYLDRLLIRFLPDAAGRMLAFQKGEANYIDYYLVPFDQVAGLKNDPKVVVTTRGGEGYGAYEKTMFNLRHPIFGKREVRQAIAHALNKEDIRSKSVAGLGRTLDSIVHSDLKWAFNPNIPKYPYDVQKANQMLDAAGYPRGADGTRFKTTLAWATGRDYEGLSAEVIRDELRAVGIQVDIRKLDRPTFIEQVYVAWNFEMAQQLGASGTDPSNTVQGRFHGKNITKVGFSNGMGWNNAEVNALFDKEVKITDQKERAQLWHKIQEIAAVELPVIPLYELPVINVYHAKFKDAVSSPYAQYESHERVWLAEGGQAGGSDNDIAEGALIVVAAVILGAVVWRRAKRRAA